MTLEDFQNYAKELGYYGAHLVGYNIYNENKGVYRIHTVKDNLNAKLGQPYLVQEKNGKIVKLSFDEMIKFLGSLPDEE